MTPTRTLDPVRRCEELLALVAWLHAQSIRAVRDPMHRGYRAARSMPNGRTELLPGKGGSPVEALLAEFRRSRVEDAE
jgi:hypothetical protein